MANKYKNFTDEQLLKEKEYLLPTSNPKRTENIKTVQNFGKTDIMHLLMLIEAMSERIENN
jgi:hypothetical protein